MWRCDPKPAFFVTTPCCLTSVRQCHLFMSTHICHLFFATPISYCPYEAYHAISLRFLARVGGALSLLLAPIMLYLSI